MVIYGKHLIYMGIGIVALIVLGIIAFKQIPKRPTSRELSQTELPLEKPPADDNINGFIKGKYPNALS